MVKTSSTINILTIITAMLLINHWSKNSFAGTIKADISNVDKMSTVNLNNYLNNNIWQQPQGFLWYNEQQVEETNKLQSYNAPSLSKLKQEREPHDQRIEDLKQKFNRAKRKALDNPTLANVIIAQRLHKQIMDKAHEFATMWQIASLIDHSLTNANEPANSLHKRLYEEKLKQENNYKLNNLAKNWGLILQLDDRCSYCKAFVPIVKQFANKYNFQLLFVSNNSSRDENIQTIKDTGLLQGLNPKNIVPVLYLMASNGKRIYPIARGLISEDKIIENIIAIDLYYQNTDNYRQANQLEVVDE